MGSNNRMTNELERIWKEAAVTLSMYHPNIHLEGLTKSLVKALSPHLPGRAKEPHENVKTAGVPASTRRVNCEGRRCASFFTSKYSPQPSL
jgi:hypothetical protein